MTATVTPYRSTATPGRDGFAGLVRAEWTKFRTVRGWVVGMLVAIAVTVLVGLLGPLGSHLVCSGPNGETCGSNRPPAGPDGTAVHDSFYFVQRPLTGAGSITVRVSTLTGAEPWAKAGLLVKDGLDAGARYAAVMVTGGHGVRMQYDFTADTAGPATSSEFQWLRLTRAGDTLTGYASMDGTRWSTVGVVDLDGLPSTVRAGLFVTSPAHVETTRTFGGASGSGGPTVATATFDRVETDGGWRDSWTGTAVDTEDTGFAESDGRFTVRGSGDIAPIVPGQGEIGKNLEDSLVGVFAGLIAVLVVATMFVTGEYRRGLIRTTLAAAPGRGRLLAAKALVIGSVAFVTGVVAAALSVPLVGMAQRAKGFFVYPVSTWTELRVIVGAGLLFAVTAVLALAVGTVLRRGAGTVTLVVVAVVLPYLMAVASVLPTGPADWLLRLTPAAGFAVQQSMPEYAQVAASYTPADGYFPVSPLGVLVIAGVYTAVALTLAAVTLRRRDA